MKVKQLYSILIAFLVVGQTNLNLSAASSPGTGGDAVSQIQDALDEMRPVLLDCPIAARIVSDFGLLAGHSPQFSPTFDPNTTEVQYDSASAVSVVNGEPVFTVPEDGLYTLSWTTILWGDLNNPARTGNYQLQRYFSHNHNLRRDLWSYSFPKNYGTSAVTLSVSDTVFLEAGDEIRFIELGEVNEPDQTKTIEKFDRVDIRKVGNLPSE